MTNPPPPVDLEALRKLCERAPGVARGDHMTPALFRLAEHWGRSNEPETLDLAEAISTTAHCIQAETARSERLASGLLSAADEIAQLLAQLAARDEEIAEMQKANRADLAEIAVLRLVCDARDAALAARNALLREAEEIATPLAKFVGQPFKFLTTGSVNAVVDTTQFERAANFRAKLKAARGEQADGVPEGALR